MHAAVAAVVWQQSTALTSWSLLQGLAGQLLDLKQLMPNTNISGLVSRYPALVLQMQPSQVAAQLQHLKQHLPGVDVERLVADEPALLRVDITKAGTAAPCCAPCHLHCALMSCAVLSCPMLHPMLVHAGKLCIHRHALQHTASRHAALQHTHWLRAHTLGASAL